MGAWGNSNFENDTATDWLNDFLAAPKESKIVEALYEILYQEEFIDSDESFEALAAAELIAAKRGDPSRDLPDEVNIKTDLACLLDPTLNMTAKQAVEKIINFKGHSELRELWQESDEYNQWLEVQKGLIKRLQ